MTHRPDILIIDPEKEIRKSLYTFLSEQGFRVREAVRGEEGLAKAVARPPDLILLELVLTDINGIEFCQQIRRWSGLPIIILSAHRDEGVIVKALDSGADDYLTKPFNRAELLARIRVGLRRHFWLQKENKIAYGSIELDFNKHLVTKNGHAVRLTAKEFKLLAYLMQHPGMVLTYPMILTEIWGKQHSNNVQSLRVYINQLRKKLESDLDQRHIIINEPHVGYRLAK